MFHHVGERKKDPLLEAVGHVTAKATWPMERTGQCIFQVQVPISKQRARKCVFVPLGLYLFWV